MNRDRLLVINLTKSNEERYGLLLISNLTLERRTKWAKNVPFMLFTSEIVCIGESILGKASNESQCGEGGSDGEGERNKIAGRKDCAPQVTGICESSNYHTLNIIFCLFQRVLW